MLSSCSSVCSFSASSLQPQPPSAAFVLQCQIDSINRVQLQDDTVLLSIKEEDNDDMSTSTLQ